ncbi:hypothetical protein AB0P15_22645 [Streptomyces sp. NPDC087917]|uniref:hypothetical protein n=1 Tax=unclassified Streptomyces TaxID=2593676 RepID=UPI0034207633
MADEHNAWLDGAAADRLLRADTAGPYRADAEARGHKRNGDHGAPPPSGTGTDPRAARLRAALDSLVPPPATGELPGEAAALAAFREARATRPSAARVPAVPAPGAGTDTLLVDLAPAPPVRIPAQRRAGTPAARFGLAAVLAGVAVGGIAAVAGAGLMDRSAHHTAGPAPAVSVSADTDPRPGGDSAGPTLAPQLRPTPLEHGAGTGAPASPGVTRVPGPDGRTPPDTGGVVPSAQSGTTTGPGGAGTGAAGGRDSFSDTSTGTGTGSGGLDKDRDKDATGGKAADLCRQYRAGRLDDDTRKRLYKLAGAPARIARFCEALLDGVRSDSPQGGTVDPGNALVPPKQSAPGSLGPAGSRTR